MKNIIIGLLIILSLLLTGINIYQNRTIKQQRDVIVKLVVYQLSHQNKCQGEGLDRTNVTTPRI